MILTSPEMLRSSAIVSDDILDNKVLIYSVYIKKDHVLTEGRLVTIREMLNTPVFRLNPPESIADLVRRYHAFESGDYESPDAEELVEALFDQETADRRIDETTDQGNSADTTIKSHFYHLGSSMISALYGGLP